jgi:hypothetical protein
MDLGVYAIADTTVGHLQSRVDGLLRAETRHALMVTASTDSFAGSRPRSDLPEDHENKKMSVFGVAVRRELSCCETRAPCGLSGDPVG